MEDPEQARYHVFFSAHLATEVNCPWQNNLMQQGAGICLEVSTNFQYTSQWI